MVRSAETRSEKYDKKLRGTVWNTRFTALKPTMVEQANSAYAQQTFNETKTKAYLERFGMYGILAHHYMNFGMRLWALTRTFTQETLRMEAEQEAAKWLRRGLDPAHLIEIAKLYGIDLTGWP
jgi:hypothetical protein